MQSSTFGLTSCLELKSVKLSFFHHEKEFTFKMILHHHQKVEFIMPKPKQT